MNIYLKNQFQEFLASKKFAYAITIEPNEKIRYVKDEVRQIFRQIEFQLNKKYLKGSFSKWSSENRFWFVIAQEGDAKSGTLHYHALLHVPSETHKRSLSWLHRDFASDFRFMWFSLKKQSKFNQIDLVYNKKPIWIDRIYDDKANAVYLTKNMSRNIDCDKVFFCH